MDTPVEYLIGAIFCILFVLGANFLWKKIIRPQDAEPGPKHTLAKTIFLTIQIFNAICGIMVFFSLSIKVEYYLIIFGLGGGIWKSFELGTHLLKEKGWPGTTLGLLCFLMGTLLFILLGVAISGIF